MGRDILRYRDLDLVEDGMSNFGEAIQKTLTSEGGYTLEADGEPVSMGLKLQTLRSWGYLGNPPASGPATPQEIAAIKGMSVTTAMQLYKSEIWDKYRCGEIEDQDVASKVFDLVTNMGPGQAIEILQRACNSMIWMQRDSLIVDGIIGPKTISEVNRLDAVDMLAAIRAEAAKVYQQIAAAHPELEGRLQGWLARLNA